MEKSLFAKLTKLLREAEAAHKNEVDSGHATNADWPEFYAAFLERQLTPMFGTLQGAVTFSVDGAALPPFYTRKSQVEIGEQYRRYVGE